MFYSLSFLFHSLDCVLFLVSNKDLRVPSEKHWSMVAACLLRNFFLLHLVCLYSGLFCCRHTDAEFILIDNEDLKNLAITPMAFAGTMRQLN